MSRGRRGRFGRTPAGVRRLRDMAARDPVVFPSPCHVTRKPQPRARNSCAASRRIRRWTHCAVRPSGPSSSRGSTGSLSTVRMHEPPLPPGPPLDSKIVRAVHWNMEHGNWYDQVENALLHDPDLHDADLLTFNEIDLGMARADNRDVTADLARSLNRFGVWAPMFLDRRRAATTTRAWRRAGRTKRPCSASRSFRDGRSTRST